ncbi:two-component sensor histidine kinase, partial [Ascidiaceihabitans sp.]|nr:two-component sensor histidine kinase [Ascidiaceihabitans sp.]
MIFNWLKHYMPRSLYGRAAMILLLPVVVLQLVVTVVFMQRHFEGVTMQMSTTVAREVELVFSGVPETTLDVLGIRVADVSRDVLVEPNTRLWFDFSGVIITRNLNKLLPQIKVIDLYNDDIVRLVADVDGQAKEIIFDRSRISAAKP